MAIGVRGGFNHNCQLPEKNNLPTGYYIVSPGFQLEYKEDEYFTFVIEVYIYK